MVPTESESARVLEPTAKRHRWRRNDKDVQRWAEMFRGGKSVLRIALEEQVAPSTVSAELHGLGFEFRMGQHRVEQPPLKYPNEFIDLVGQGQERVLEFVKGRVWGIGVTEMGKKQVESFCEFVRLHRRGVGVKEIARTLGVHRTTVAEWREGTDQPYLIRALNETLLLHTRPGWKCLPMHLSSGGNELTGWIRVPQVIREFGEIEVVLSQLHPLGQTYHRAVAFGLSTQQVMEMKVEFFAYLLGIMVGDSSKHGGALNRYASMCLDLELTRKQPTNERLGIFVMMCANSLGIAMERRKDKGPSGVQLKGKEPTPAFRWTSERSPLLAWAFSVCLGLHWGETTTANQLRMDWIFGAPDWFRKRFIQGSADSDGCTRRYVTDISSVPNAGFFTDLLRSLGMKTARISYEKGMPLRTAVSTAEASTLPIFSEYVRSYRYERMMNWLKRGRPNPDTKLGGYGSR
jgi:hypothetical protein